MRFRGRENFKIELLERYPCKDEIELTQREQYWLDKLDPTLNVKNAYASPELKKQQKQLNEKKRRLVTVVCCGRTIQKESLAEHKISSKHLRNKINKLKKFGKLFHYKMT
jgi:hypothetical protein